jgi:hypothetical protein
MQAFRPRGNSATFSGVALEQREIELAALDRAARLHAQPTAHVEPQTRA